MCGYKWVYVLVGRWVSVFNRVSGEESECVCVRERVRGEKAEEWRNEKERLTSAVAHPRSAD